MSCCLTPSGICQPPVHSGWFVSATLIKSDQIGSADAAPVNPNCDPSSNPTQTTQTRLGVKPANQASRDLPVLPATLNLKPRARIGAPVPRLTTSFINEVITYAISGRSTSFFCAVGLAIVVPFPVVTRSIAIGVVRVPFAANAAYADATCSGVASAVPTAMAGKASATP